MLLVVCGFVIAALIVACLVLLGVGFFASSKRAELRDRIDEIAKQLGETQAAKKALADVLAEKDKYIAELKDRPITVFVQEPFIYMMADRVASAMKDYAESEKRPV